MSSASSPRPDASQYTPIEIPDQERVGAIFAGYMRGRIFERWNKILGGSAESAGLWERLHVAVWALDSRTMTYACIANSSVAHPLKRPTDVWLYPETAGHMDLVWRELHPLYVRSLVHSTRAYNVLANPTTSLGETFICPLGDHDHHYPAVIYVTLAPPGKGSPVDGEPSRRGEMLNALKLVAGEERAFVQSILEKIQRGEFAAKRRAPEAHQASEEPRAGAKIFEEITSQILGTTKKRESPATSLGIGATTFFPLLAEGDSAFTYQMAPHVHEGYFTSQWTRIVQRSIFAREDSRMIGRATERNWSTLRQPWGSRIGMSPRRCLCMRGIHRNAGSPSLMKTMSCRRSLT